MIPAQFDYVVAKSLEDAIELLARYGPEARILAGGHSLVPLMKVRMASPSALIDIGQLEELRYIREEGGDFVIGGMTTYRTIETSPLLRLHVPLLAEAASQIGDVQVRNRGTIGGSLVHADPAADLPAAILALEARMKVIGPGGSREVPADQFFVDMLQSAVDKGEILTEVRISRSRVGKGMAYRKAPQPASGFALVGVAVNLSHGARIGVTGVGVKPYRATEVEWRLNGMDPESIRAACTFIAEGIEVLSDIHASAEYRKDLAAVYARRAIEAAAAL